MSACCSHCGRKTTNNEKAHVNSSKYVQHKDEQDDTRWSCFVSFCSKKQSMLTRTNEVAFNSEFNDSGAIYKTGSVTQLQVEPIADSIPYRRITYNKVQHPVSKFKVMIKYC